MADFGGLEQSEHPDMRKARVINESSLLTLFGNSEHPNLNLSAEEQRLFTQVFSAADSDSLGVVTGDVALKFFPERTKLPSEVLGEVGFDFIITDWMALALTRLDRYGK